MPLSKSDAPNNAGSVRPLAPMTAGKATSDADATPTPAEDRKATNAAIDASAGAPAEMRAPAEALPEKDDVQKAIKEGMLATDAQTEAKAKAKVVDMSPDAADTPSGYALKKVAGIADDVKRGEAYAREKSAKRWGYVPAESEK